MTEHELKRPFNPDTLREIADSYGTPTYCYSEQIIRDRISLLRSHVSGTPVHLSYAAKANVALPILRLMLDEGLGVDVVSPAELELAIRVGFAPDQILYSANNMTDQEMNLAASKGVVMNVGELSRLKRFGQDFPCSRVCVRLNPQIGAGHHKHVITAGRDSKFGIPVEQTDEIKRIVSEYDLQLIGLHQHIGSGILDTDVVWAAIAVMLDVAIQFDSLQFINLGGGLGVPYGPNEHALDLSLWREKIVRPLEEYRGRHPSTDLTFVFEPGRFLVAEAGVLLVRVNTIKETEHHLFAGVDSGMGHLSRPAIYGAYHAVYNLSHPDGELNTYDIVGNICESADFFARERAIQEIRVGDLLAILDVGAYGMSMASLYNMRPLPAQLWLPAEGTEIRLVTARESATELIDRLYPGLD